MFVPSLSKGNEGGGWQEVMPGVHINVCGDFLTFYQQLLVQSQENKSTQYLSEVKEGQSKLAVVRSCASLQ